MARSGIKVKSLFFDRQAVIDAIGRANAAVLSKAGAFIWRAAKTSMRRTKKSAAPGQPPRAHSGELRDLLFFSYDPRAKSVVVGPEKFGSNGGVVPPLMERGGTVTRRLKSGRTRVLRYNPHPFMSPALAKSIPQLPPMWKGSVVAKSISA